MKSGTIKKENLIDELSKLKEKGIFRIISISGVDLGKEFEVIYHFSEGLDLLNLKVKLSKQNSQIESIQELFPGAVLFERELSEQLGIKIIGNKFKRLFLPENYRGKPPLLKEKSNA